MYGLHTQKYKDGQTYILRHAHSWTNVHIHTYGHKHRQTQMEDIHMWADMHTNAQAYIHKDRYTLRCTYIHKIHTGRHVWTDMYTNRQTYAETDRHAHVEMDRWHTCGQAPCTKTLLVLITHTEHTPSTSRHAFFAG